MRGLAATLRGAGSLSSAPLKVQRNLQLLIGLFLGILALGMRCFGTSLWSHSRLGEQDQGWVLDLGAEL